LAKSENIENILLSIGRYILLIRNEFLFYLKRLLKTNENTKGDIIGYIKDLRFNQHKTIREIAAITGKSGRDVIALLKESVDLLNKDTQGNIVETKNQEIESAEQEDPPLNIKAYRLFSEGKSLVDVTVALNLNAEEAHQFYGEFWKLTQMHQLFVIYQENKDSIGYFLKLVRLGKREGITPEQIIDLLKMTDNTKDLNEKFQYLQGEVTDMELKKSVIKEQLEDLEYKISSAEEQLSETDKAYKLKFGELSGMCYQIRMLEYQIERFKNCKDYQGIEKIAKDKVNELLTDDKKLLEYALISVTEALRKEPDRYLLINEKPYNSLGSIQSILYEGDCQFAKEKVLELADKIFYKLQKGIVDNTLTAVLGSKEIVEAEAGDIAP
jgi:hypothetical protein